MSYSAVAMVTDDKEKDVQDGGGGLRSYLLALTKEEEVVNTLVKCLPRRKHLNCRNNTEVV